MKDLQFKLNNNGDSYPEMSGQMLRVAEAAQVLVSALQQAYPHGRNYQTVDDSLQKLVEDQKVVHDKMREASGLMDWAVNQTLRTAEQGRRL